MQLQTADALTVKSQHIDSWSDNYGALFFSKISW